VLTGDARYLRAAVLACQAGAGANPLNLCYTTGLGYQSPENPLHIDSRITGQAPPPGLTVFGPSNPEQMGQDWAIKLVDQTCYPPSSEWPIMEGYWDVFWYPMVCEFTVQTPMAANAYTWGYLAARP
jgi:endoglucanase